MQKQWLKRLDPQLFLEYRNAFASLLIIEGNKRMLWRGKLIELLEFLYGVFYDRVGIQERRE